MPRRAAVKLIKGRVALEEFLRHIMKKDRVKFNQIKVCPGPPGFYMVAWEERY